MPGYPSQRRARASFFMPHETQRASEQLIEPRRELRELKNFTFEDLYKRLDRLVTVEEQPQSELERLREELLRDFQTNKVPHFAESIHHPDPTALGRLLLAEPIAYATYAKRPIQHIRSKVQEHMLIAVEAAAKPQGETPAVIDEEERKELVAMLEDYDDPTIAEATMIVMVEMELLRRAKGEQEGQFSREGLHQIKRMPRALMASLANVDPEHPDVRLISEEGGFSPKESAYIASWYRKMGDKPDARVIAGEIDRMFPETDDVPTQKRAILSRLLSLLEAYPLSVRTPEDYGFPAWEEFAGESVLLERQLVADMKEDAELEPSRVRTETDDFRMRLSMVLREKVVDSFLCLHKQQADANQQSLCARQIVHVFSGFAAEIAGPKVAKALREPNVNAVDAIHAHATQEAQAMVAEIEPLIIENMDARTAHSFLNVVAREMQRGVEAHMRYDALNVAALDARRAIARQETPRHLDDFFAGSGASGMGEHHSVEQLDALRLAQKAAIDRQERALWP